MSHSMVSYDVYDAARTLTR